MLLPGGQGVGVVGAEHPQPVGEQLLEAAGGGRRVPGLAATVGELVTGCQGVRVIGAEGGPLFAQQDLALLDGLLVEVAVG